MTSPNPEASDITEQFLAHIPSEYHVVLRPFFKALAEEQQQDALGELERVKEDAHELDEVMLSLLMENDLSQLVNSAFPKIMSRLLFWEKFLRNQTTSK